MFSPSTQLEAAALHAGQRIRSKIDSFQNANFLISQLNPMMLHSLESSRRDDFNESHIIGFGWEMRKLSRKPFCSLFLNYSPDYRSTFYKEGAIQLAVSVISCCFFLINSRVITPLRATKEFPWYSTLAMTWSSTFVKKFGEDWTKGVGVRARTSKFTVLYCLWTQQAIL